jgi:hypothetical protein
VAQVVPQVIDPSVAEAVALWRAVKMCGDLGCARVIFEGDSLTIVNAVCQDVPCWSNYDQLIEDTHTLLQGFDHYHVVRHIYQTSG